MAERRINIMPGEPIVKSTLSPDGLYIFCEFRTVEEATKCLELNTTMYKTTRLRIGRPKLLAQQLDRSAIPALPWIEERLNQVTPALATYDCAGGSGELTNVPELPVILERLCISNIPRTMSEQQVREFLFSFGSCRFIYLIKKHDSEEHEGVVICEYEDADCSDMAEKTFKDMQLDGNKLRLDRYQDAIKEPHLAELFAYFPNLEALMRPEEPTPILMLQHLVDPDELILDEDYDDIVLDVKVECAKYGVVMSLHVPRPTHYLPMIKDKGDHSTSNIDIKPATKDGPPGYAFVEFSRVEGAKTAKKMLNGRKFGAGIVEVHYFNERLYQLRDFSHPSPNFVPFEGPMMLEDVKDEESGYVSGSEMEVKDGKDDNEEVERKEKEEKHHREKKHKKEEKHKEKKVKHEKKKKKKKKKKSTLR
eukprot:Platyproteum_vivax@DN6449_c0_g1_i4.p1